MMLFSSLPLVSSVLMTGTANYLSNIQLVLPFCSSSVDIRHCGARAAC